MDFNLGRMVGNILPFDPTPNFQLSRNNSSGSQGWLPIVGYDEAALKSRQQAQTPSWQNTLANATGPTRIPTSGASGASDGGSYSGGGGSYSGGGGYSTGYDAQAAAAAAQAEREKQATLAFYDDQQNQLRSLLGRTDTGLNQGLTKLNDDFNTEKNFQENERSRAMANYGDKRNETNQGKVKAYDKINKNANSGYRSLAQIIGRASGTGSSAFREALPDAVGQVTSGERVDATETYGQNLRGIQKAEDETKFSFENILQDLDKQRKSGEGDLRSNIEGQRQNINAQLAEAAAKRAQAAGGGYAEARAAQAPFQSAIENSRNAVEGFFNQYRTPYTRQAANISNPELSQYTTDRAQVNARQQGGNTGNPYTDIIRKRLQEEQAV